ncbi:MAG TPA: hypothetical protein VG965_02195 [Patescibacteria group bacterium]|nr:hypothetical protein [Patescibacteria group bacterium]
MDKILKISIVVLIACLAFEVYYLYIYKTDSGTRYATQKPSIKKPQSNSAVSTGITNYIASFDKNILKKSEISNEIEGKIAKVLDAPGVMNQFQYEKGLAIARSNGQSVVNYYFLRKSDIPKLKVVQNGQNIQFSDLKIGDTIKIEETMDLLAAPGSNRESVEIDKL